MALSDSMNPSARPLRQTAAVSPDTARRWGLPAAFPSGAAGRRRALPRGRRRAGRHPQGGGADRVRSARHRGGSSDLCSTEACLHAEQAPVALRIERPAVPGRRGDELSAGGHRHGSPGDRQGCVPRLPAGGGPRQRGRRSTVVLLPRVGGAAGRSLSPSPSRRGAPARGWPGGSAGGLAPSSGPRWVFSPRSSDGRGSGCDQPANRAKRSTGATSSTEILWPLISAGLPDEAAAAADDWASAVIADGVRSSPRG